MIGLVVIAAAGLALTGPARPASDTQLEFKGAALDMTLAAWNTSPFPGAGERRAVCSDGPDAHAVGIALSADERREGALVCTYTFADRGGPRAEVPIGDGLLARRVRYVFKDGRLVSIGYRASPDAFDAIVARVDSQLGRAAQIARDRVRLDDGSVVARVRMRWAGPAGVVALTDPIETGRLSVVLSTPSYAQGRALVD